MNCPYCGNKAELVKGDKVYPHREDLHKKNFWLCAPCDAYCGTHSDSTKPLGELANKELRRWRLSAHNVFDPCWQTRFMTRTEAYKFLSKILSIPKEKCHIGMFDVETCKKVVYYFKRG